MECRVKCCFCCEERALCPDFVGSYVVVSYYKIGYWVVLWRKNRMFRGPFASRRTTAYQSFLMFS